MQKDEFLAPRVRWIMLLALLAPANFLLAVDRALVTVSAPLLQAKFDLSLSQLGMTFSVFYLAYAAMQVPAGMIVDRFGPRLSLFVAIIVWSASTLVTPFAGSFIVLLVVRAILGLGQAPDWPASVVASRRLFDAKDRPVANSVLLCALYGGPVIGAPLAGLLLKSISLEGVFVLFGVLGFAFALLWWLFYRDASTPSPSTSRATLLATSKAGFSGYYWLIVPAYACMGSVLGFYMAWFPTYLMKVRGLDIDTMGIYLGINAGALCVSALVAGRVLLALSKFVEDGIALRIATAVCALAIAGVATFSIPLVGSAAVGLAISCVAVAGVGFAQVAAWSTIQDLAGEKTARFTGFVSLGGNFGGAIVPLGSAAMIERFGNWDSSFWMLGAASVIGATFWLIVGLKHRRVDAIV
ncbi:MFS transporter [Sphingobium boeckii]|uniref:ACS family glucarate transporter-like MFS transporter n=1 Tax=Sphingobium boeckii TaxID=1082345 RepID=A0A7W9AFZ0_9SPHN|nr:MFS transporter [Sphingobium boeckii]MBB5684952.1 ACS family glucarate transporter-like MFS transporter [Sphingobium boeckii]